jgi:predicted DsbA family dithiol-disulfide isomerase
MPPTRITHFSDVLCVWAYVTQVRMDELQGVFQQQIGVDYRFLSLFGATEQKLGKGWADRGGKRGYGAHVRDVVATFDHVDVHRDVWCQTTPPSSMPAHLALCATRLLPGPPRSVRLLRALRHAFFAEQADIARHDVILGIAESEGLPVPKLVEHLEAGRAHAELAEDARLAQLHHVGVSPTLVFNEGRQNLAGNVGYRVIEANVRELLARPEGLLPWC